MDHFDYVGLAVLITVIVQGIVTLMAAIQSWRNGRDIKEVKKQVNGVTQALVDQTHYSGVLEGRVEELRSREPPKPGPTGQ